MALGFYLATLLALLGNHLGYATPTQSHYEVYETSYLKHRSPQLRGGLGSTFWGSGSNTAPAKASSSPSSFWGTSSNSNGASASNPFVFAFDSFTAALNSAFGNSPGTIVTDGETGITGWGSPPKPNTPPALPTVITPAPAPAPAPAIVKGASILATVKQDKVTCKRFPDTIVSDPAKNPTLTTGNKLEITCWTTSVMPNSAGKVGGDGIWLKTNLDCYINEADFQEKQDYQKKLQRCDSPPHWVGKLQDQYKRKDCYVCPSLNCHSHNLRNPPYVDLDCTTVGDSINGDSTWHKAKDEPCFFPAGVFDQKGWLGTAGGTCPEPLMCINGPCRPPTPPM